MGTVGIASLPEASRLWSVAKKVRESAVVMFASARLAQGSSRELDAEGRSRGSKVAAVIGGVQQAPYATVLGMVGNEKPWLSAACVFVPRHLGGCCSVR